jgi:predicted RNA-binding Zn ribbon-like protein
MHKFFREHNFAIYSVEGRLNMLAELREIQETLNRAHATLTAMTKALSQLLAKLKGHEILSDQMTHSLMADGKRVGMI